MEGEEGMVARTTAVDDGGVCCRRRRRGSECGRCGRRCGARVSRGKEWWWVDGIGRWEDMVVGWEGSWMVGIPPI